MPTIENQISESVIQITTKTPPTHLQDRLQTGTTSTVQLNVAAVEHELKRLGAEDNFMLIASGGREVMGMTPPGERRLQVGDLVRTELTPQVNGYWCQICRTAVLGEPDPAQRRSSELFLEALEAGLAAVRAGVTADEVARAENDVFRRHGYGEYCTSRYTRVRGHGHGLHPDIRDCSLP